MKKRFSEEQIVRILRKAEILGVQIREVCRNNNITEQTFFRRRNKYGMEVPDARRLEPRGRERTTEKAHRRASARD